MFQKLFIKDCQKRPWNVLILFLLMTLSVTIAVSVCMMTAQLFTSIQTMYDAANPPHFLQMHKGTFEQEDIDTFNAAYQGLTHAQTVPMIDVYGDSITVKNASQDEFSLADCRLDISLVKQNEGYDVLLDENRRPCVIQPGTIGVPSILLSQYNIAPGDTVTVADGETRAEFTVAEIIYDGQMNSTLCSSTRFLISDEDYAQLTGKLGENEYLIEAYFSNTGEANAYQSAYEQSTLDLPKNGQAVTYPIIFLLSAMTDLMTALIIVLAGILLIVIALVCLRFTVLAEIEDEKQEIGTMKAIGIPSKGISALYLWKIRLLMLASGVAGFVIAVAALPLFTGHMRRTFGQVQMDAVVYLAGICAAVCVYLLVLLFTRCLLRKIKKVSVVDLLVNEKGFGRPVKVQDGLHKAKRVPVSLAVSGLNVRHGYGTVCILLLLTTVMILLPMRITNTMEAKDFVTYMGSPVSDAFLEIDQGTDLETRKAAVDALLSEASKRGEVTDIQVLRRICLQTKDADGEFTNLHIDTGKSAGEGLAFLEGKSPSAANEIALSSLQAEQLDKKLGDTVILETKEAELEPQTVTVSGIYQDVTSGGKTAKMAADFPSLDAEKYSFQLRFSSDTNVKDTIQSYRTTLGGGFSIEDMDEFIHQTVGGNRCSSAGSFTAYAGAWHWNCGIDRVPIFETAPYSKCACALREKNHGHSSAGNLPAGDHSPSAGRRRGHCGRSVGDSTFGKTGCQSAV